MLIKRLDGKKESAEESSEEYKNAIEGKGWKNSYSRLHFQLSLACFAAKLSINKAN